MATWRTLRATRTLDLDLENRPLNYSGHDDFTFSEITAIACADIHQTRNGQARPLRLMCWALGEDDPHTMLYDFRLRYVDADIITGHNLLKHDLRLLNGAMLEYGYPPLPPRLVSDTYLHLKRRSGVSASQASLAAMLGIKAPKISMSQTDWREANRLYESGIEKTRARCIGDVKQHILLRAELLRRDWLRTPRVWNP